VITNQSDKQFIFLLLDGQITLNQIIDRTNNAFCNVGADVFTNHGRFNTA